MGFVDTDVGIEKNLIQWRAHWKMYDFRLLCYADSILWTRL